MITLSIVKDGQREALRFADATVIAVGRAPGNALRIADAKVSSLHGELVRRGQQWAYRDLRSTNGSWHERAGVRTAVDGVTTPEVGLADGDLLLLGDASEPVVVAVGLPDAPQPPAPRPAGEHTLIASRVLPTDAGVAEGLLGGPNPEAARLLRLLRDIAGEEDVRGAFACVGDYLFEGLPAATQVMLVVDDEAQRRSLVSAGGSPEPHLAMRRGGDPVESDALPYPRGLVAAALARKEALSAVLGADNSSHDQSLGRLGTLSALAAPLNPAANRTGDGALVVLLSAPPGEPDLDKLAALAAQLGAAFNTARLMRRLRAVERRLREENKALRSQAEVDITFPEIIGRSAGMRTVFDAMRLVMDTDANVLVLGETGTGKELVARALHEKSRRASRQFAAVNCAALAENLLESELFGHLKGAFTGAIDTKKGLFQVADRGTLFLDELGEMSLALQAKLLRALQEGEILPVGSSRPLKVDVRLVCATHRDLRALVKAGQFREDLYYRINVFPIALPPLRERRGDVASLATFFVEKYEKRFNKAVAGLSPTALARLEAYAFPGNIRELENEMQRAVLLTPAGQSIDLAVLSEPIRVAVALTGETLDALTDPPDGSKLRDTMDQLEREVLRRALEDRGWNRSQTARELGISRQALMVKLAKYQLEPE